MLHSSCALQREGCAQGRQANANPRPISEVERVLRVMGLLVLGAIFQAGALSLGLMRDHGPGTWSYGGLQDRMLAGICALTPRQQHPASLSIAHP